MTREELLPCPFCGPGQSMVDPWFDDVSKRWAIGCGRCGASSGRSVHAEGSKEAAIKSWNTRCLGGVAQTSGWQPIETALRDGARIILAWDNIPSLPYHWEVGFFRSNSRRSPAENYGGWCNTYGHAFSGEPTHWMLPAPPSNQGASK